MENIIQFILYFHAFSGSMALLSGLAAIATKKGSKKHIIGGQVYFWSMFLVIITGLIVGFYRDNLFLQTIAIFSFYMAFTGKRVLRYKKAIRPQPIDWFVSVVSIATGAFMLYLGVVNMIRIGFAGAVPMLLIFGAFLFTMALQDMVKMKRKKIIKNEWLFTHIGRMSGSFIATSTAFILVNVRFEPRWIVWLTPTIIGTPLIFYTVRKWNKKLNPPKTKQG